jgi:hypothetical protein
VGEERRGKKKQLATTFETSCGGLRELQESIVRNALGENEGFQEKRSKELIASC